MIAVEQWTGKEALLLQQATRSSVRDFAQRLGISARAISYWKKAPGTVCSHDTAQLLDTALSRCNVEERELFRVLLANLRGEPANALADDSARPAPCTVVSHKFLPVYLGEQSALLYAVGAPGPTGPGGLEQHVIPVESHPARTSTVHIYACGIAVMHVEEHRRVDTLTELAVWRYRTYVKERAWAGDRISRLLQQHASDEDRVGLPPAPQYVLSAYELRHTSWTGPGLDTGLHLLSTPSVLVDRQDPGNVVPLGTGVEDAKFRARWTHPEAIAFGGGVSRGVAGWSGVAYHPQSDERALTMTQIVALELDVQALWALSSHVLHMIEDGLDPVMPTGYGWRFMRGAYVRLTTARPTETAQHRVMREAILATSELPDRLRAAQDALRESDL
ncbi:XRE family transcriptional regulator [Embleya sp. NBC_00896]|uniref:XRE family transcriptional regulator n=1 Tax=Embleya sp. NBC_00896 TaxID=2975961 RepID=UPI002F9078D8|nr:XRE family transcriptional regulator [Embleya sp. NBC_00896]